MPRPRKTNVKRDAHGKSRGEPHEIHPEVIAVRERILRADGIVLEFKRPNGMREEVIRTATNAKAGTALGRLLLRWEQGNRETSISPEQYYAGDAWASLVRKHALLMGYSLGPKAASFEIGGGRSCNEPLEETIIFVRRQFSDCHNALCHVAQIHGGRVYQVTEGVCLQDWPAGTLKPRDYGKLRIGLNAISKALDNEKKIRYGETQ